MENNLLLAFPDIAKQWDYSKNANGPEQYAPHSNKKVWWICAKGHSFECSIDHRTGRQQGCSYCSGKKVLEGYNDLATICPELLVDWDYSKNSDYAPTQLTAHSNKKVWWHCNICGHSWKTSVNDRSNGRNCPVCSKSKQGRSYQITMLKKNKNDLATIRPDLLDEWDYEQNRDLMPDSISINAKKRVWWKCRICGKSWQTSISNRAIGNSGCPSCMRHQSTSFPEQAILFYICKECPKTINSFRDLFSDGKTELDIYVPERNVAIEYDGKAWHTNARALKKSKEKYKVCKDNGIKLMRISENDNPEEKAYCDFYIYRNDLTSKGLDKTIKEILGILSIIVNDVDVDSDRSSIMQQYITNIREKSIAFKYPEAISEWDFERNNGLSPEMVNASSNVNYWWKCNLGHPYQATPANKLPNKHGCPYCSGHRLWKGFNDFETRYPQLAMEWDFEYNNPILPSEVMPGTIKKYGWICKKGHKYLATVNARTSVNSGCPYCSGKTALKGFNDLESKHPEVLEYWDYEKNTISPFEVLPGSDKVVWWHCKKNHSWKKSIGAQVKHNNCPVCNQIILVSGENDLSITNPELCLEWDYEKNGDLNPETLSPGANKKVWWICSRGHSYQAWLNDRTGKRKTGCPECSYLSKTKRVVCVETGEIFESATMAAASVKKSPTSIANCCRGISKSCGGFRWNYLD